MTIPTAAELGEARRIARRIIAARIPATVPLEDDVLAAVLDDFATRDLAPDANWRGDVGTLTNTACEAALSAYAREHGDVLPRAGLWDHLTAEISPIEADLLHASVQGYSNRELAERFGLAGADAVVVVLARLRDRVGVSGSQLASA